jgi:hypothetical protein
LTLAYPSTITPLLQRFDNIGPLLLIATGVAYYLLNTVPIAAVISLAEGKRFGETWHSCYLLVVSILSGRRFAGVDHQSLHQADALASFDRVDAGHLFDLPLVRALSGAPGRRETARGVHRRLHMRTIEALALAIEAKDHTTHEHLRRVRVYAVEIGKQLGLSGPKNWRPSRLRRCCTI